MGVGAFARCAAFVSCIAILSGACSGSHTTRSLRAGTPPARAPASVGPRWFAVASHGRIQWYESTTGASIGVSGGPKNVVVTSIASWHDGRSVVLAAQRPRDKCASLVQRQRVDSSTELTETDLPHLGSVPAVVDAMAVSADHQLLAMAVRVSDRSGDACDHVELWVVDLRSGGRKVWPLPRTASDAPPDNYFVTNLAWEPQGRRLALEYGQCCANAGGVWILDSAAPAGPLLNRLRKVPIHGSCVEAVQAWTASGLFGTDDNDNCGGGPEHLVAIDPGSGDERALAMPTVGMANQISSDTTATHLLVYADQAVYRVDRNAASAVRLMPLPWDSESPPQIAW